MRAHRRSAIEITFSGGDEIARNIHIRALAINFCHIGAVSNPVRINAKDTCLRALAKDDNITHRARFVHSNTRALHARAA